MCLVWWPTDSHKTLLFTMLLSNHFWRKEGQNDKHLQTITNNLVFFFLPHPSPGITDKMITSEVTANAEQKKNDWKLWELVNMGVVLPQPQSLWEDGYGRGLTKGGGKLGPPAFFSFEAVTTQKRALTQSGLDLPAAHRARQSRTQGVAVTTWVVFFSFLFFSPHNRLMCVL